jgi:hypothetical protein
MPTLGTQNISTSYVQLIKTSGTTGIDGTIQTITDGNNVSSALQLSTAGVNSTGTLNAVGATTLASTLSVTAACTLSSTLGVTGAVTLSSSLGVTGVATFSSSISATTGTVTIGTESVNVSTIASATFGTARITGSTGGVTAFNYGTAAFTGATLQDLDSITTGSNITTGTFTVSGAAIGDIVFGGLTSLSSSSGTAGVPATGARMMSQFRVEGANVVRYTILNTDTISHGTIPAGTLYATALRFIA